MLNMVSRNGSHCTTKWLLATLAAMLLIANSVMAQALPGLWGSSLYRVQLTVSGSAVSGTFTSLDNPQAPPGSITGQLRPGGRAFTATWTRPLGPDTASFSTWLSFAAKGSLLTGYRWSDETQPAAFALHRAVNGQLVQVLDGDSVTGDGETGPEQKPGTAAGAGAARDRCLDNMRELSGCAAMYILKHGGKLPEADKWVAQLREYATSEAIFRCPSAPDLKCGYAMNAALSGANVLKLPEIAKAVLFFDSPLGTENPAGGREAVCAPGRHDGGNCYVYGGCQVKWLAEIPRLNP